MVYAAASPAVALLETLVHVEAPEALLAFEYVAIPIDFDEESDLLIHLSSEDLPDDWKAWPWPASTQRLGAQWMREARSVLLDVPSAVVPHERNYLINPRHPQFGDLQIGSPEAFPIDPRLVR